MLLKHIYLYLNLDEYPDELATPFGFRTRYICNFLEQRLKSEKFHADGFSKICVQGTSSPQETCPIVSDNAAVPSVRFDQALYEALGQDGHHELFIAMLREGLEKCSRHHNIPLSPFEDSLKEFRRGSYKNEWTHQSKLLRPVGLRASLLCSLDPDRFQLTLRLDHKGEAVFNEPILETMPDEIIFAHRFKRVVLDGDDVVVEDKFGAPTFSLRLSSLSR